MIILKAQYYGGSASVQHPVDIEFLDSGKVLIQGGTVSREISIDRLTIAARLGNSRRHIYLPDGGKLETSDNVSIDRVCRQFGNNRAQSLLHLLEKNLMSVVSALLLTVLIIWAGIEFGVPVAAHHVAKHLPESLETKIGKQALEELDQWQFFESEAVPALHAELSERLQQLTRYAAGNDRYRVEFRSSDKMGANALALPGGIISDRRASAIGGKHGTNPGRAGTRNRPCRTSSRLAVIVAESFTALFMAGLLGDITSITSFSVALPTLLVETRYSRRFEIEADRHAVELMQTHDIAVEHFIRILTLLEQHHGSDSEFDYLSSHPATSKRIEAISGNTLAFPRQ